MHVALPLMTRLTLRIKYGVPPVEVSKPTGLSYHNSGNQHLRVEQKIIASATIPLD